MEKVTIHPRKLARQMAKAQLNRQKVTGYNKENIGPTGNKMPSLFARNWKQLAQEAAGMIKPKKKGKK